MKTSRFKITSVGFVVGFAIILALVIISLTVVLKIKTDANQGFLVGEKPAEKVPQYQYPTWGNWDQNRTGLPHIVRQMRQYQGHTEVLQGTYFSNETVTAHSGGFVHSVIMAHNQHHNLVIRPDDIWIAILTQFSFYINANAEKFRGKFVNFTGQKQLEVIFYGGNRYSVSYATFVSKMMEKIHQNIIDPEVKDWVLPNFSTSTTDDRVTCGVALMATLKKYFTYGLGILCGIPQIVLEGTVEDWRNIYKRAQRLKKYELEEWVEMLNPILEKFIEAKEGQPDREFWKKICSYHRGGCGGGDGSPRVYGWITVFSVFNGDGEWRGTRSSNDRWPSTRLSDVAPGIVEVDVLINDNGDEYNSTMFAGHMGNEILDDGYTIQPRSGWAVAIKAKYNATVEALQYDEYD